MKATSLSFLLSLLVLFLFIGPACSQRRRRQRQRRQRPHMLVIMADDLGWSDVGFRDRDMHTPHIDTLASQGVLFNSSYMMQVCTPSRAAFLSGYYPFRMGLQHSVLTALSNNSMPLQYRLFPETLQDLGYRTHYVGKWHLGFCRLAMTPTHRGFHTFYGMYNGKGDYFTHKSKWNGYDLHDDVGHGDARNFSIPWADQGTYSTHLFTDRALDIIDQHDPSSPLFLFLSYQAVHGPLQVPERYVSEFCGHVTGRDRKLHCAMTAAMDEGMGKVMDRMRQTGMADNLLTLFTSDNGGPIKLASSNWPLRGSKVTLWEGGTRVVSILHSTKHLPNAPYTWNGLMHAVDWYPTLLKAAGVRRKELKALRGMDGVDNWRRIVKNKRSRRREFVYNIDDVKNNSALRFGRFKLVNNKPGQPDGWYNPPAGVVNNKTVATGKFPEYMLFDLNQDPSEEQDLSGVRRYGKVLARMKTKLESYKAQVMPTVPSAKINAGKPQFHGGAWVSGWC